MTDTTPRRCGTCKHFFSGGMRSFCEWTPPENVAVPYWFMLRGNVNETCGRDCKTWEQRAIIGYDCMRGGWCDETDPTFFVDMTPGPGDELEFNSREDFYKWYNGND